jgi:hypothetical protein
LTLQSQVKDLFRQIHVLGEERFHGVFLKKIGITGDCSRYSIRLPGCVSRVVLG